MKKWKFIVFYLLIGPTLLYAQHISEFNSLSPGLQDYDLHLPSSHSFQYIIQFGDSLTEGGNLPPRCDFAGFVPINSSSSLGYLSINSEFRPGGVTVLDIKFQESIGKWLINKSEAIDFSTVGGTARNCSGTVTPWNTIITCEEDTLADSNQDGYRDLGWAIEVDPASKKIRNFPGGLEDGDKLWALGNFKHENVVVHNNRRTAYQGVDQTVGYLYKFVADTAEWLHSGALYVYKGEKLGSGVWIRLNNTTPDQQNSTLFQSDSVGATVFSGIEDVEISPMDSMVYVAVKRENRVYRFKDSDPISGTTVTNFETFVGGKPYEIPSDTGYILEPWGTGNDNLAFDDRGNLWVMQDGGKNYVWFVEQGHTQEQPKVKIFARLPKKAEPTGITFTPDYRYLFMSIQHPDSANGVVQFDAFGKPFVFNKDIVIVVALDEFLNKNLLGINGFGGDESPFQIYPNPAINRLIVSSSANIHIKDLQLIDTNGKDVFIKCSRLNNVLVLDLEDISQGLYFLKILDGRGKWTSQRILISR